MHIRHESVAHYTVTGALSGAVSTGLGACVLHPADPDHFARSASFTAGFVGGAITHAGIGLLAAFSHDESRKVHIQKLGASAVLSALTSGIIGGAVLAATGHDEPSSGHLLLSGAIGGAILGVAGGAIALSLCMCKVGLWCGEKAHDEAYRVLEGQAQA